MPITTENRTKLRTRKGRNSSLQKIIIDHTAEREVKKCLGVENADFRKDLQRFKNKKEKKEYWGEGE